MDTGRAHPWVEWDQVGSRFLAFFSFVRHRSKWRITLTKRFNAFTFSLRVMSQLNLSEDLTPGGSNAFLHCELQLLAGLGRNFILLCGSSLVYELGVGLIRVM